MLLLLLLLCHQGLGSESCGLGGEGPMSLIMTSRWASERGGGRLFVPTQGLLGQKRRRRPSWLSHLDDVDGWHSIVVVVVVVVLRKKPRK